MFRVIVDKVKQIKNPIKYWKEKGVEIGEHCEIYSSVSFGSEPYLVRVGNHVRINSGVNFITHDGGVWVVKKYLNIDESKMTLGLYGSISIGDNVHIGTNAIILPNVNIGNNCIIGVGAVVTKDIPDNSIAAGIPAKVIEVLDEYIYKHKEDFEQKKYASIEEKRRELLKKYK